jgi:hypothetical protein
MTSRWWELIRGRSGEMGDASPTRPAPLSPDVHRLDAQRVTAILCEAGAEALVLSLDDGVVARARFVDLTEDTFRLSLDQPVPPLIRAPTQCAVACCHGTQNVTFVATVLSVRHAELLTGPASIVCRIPGAIASGDPRMSPRVRIPADAALELELSVRGTTLPEAKGLELSLCGILIDAGAYPGTLRPGDEVSLQLRDGQRQVGLRAEVHRLSAHGLALVFPDVLQSGELAPPQELREMVSGLERSWRCYETPPDLLEASSC